MADEFTATDGAAVLPGVEHEPEPIGANPVVTEAASAFWDGFTDFAEDAKLSESARDRMLRAGRTLAQGLASAVVVGAAPVVWDVLRGDPTNVSGAAAAFGTATLAAVAAYFHKRK